MNDGGRTCPASCHRVRSQSSRARRSRPAGGTYWGGSVSAVPEPSALALLAFAPSPRFRTPAAPVGPACRAGLGVCPACRAGLRSDEG